MLSSSSSSIVEWKKMDIDSWTRDDLMLDRLLKQADVWERNSTLSQNQWHEILDSLDMAQFWHFRHSILGETASNIPSTNWRCQRVTEMFFRFRFSTARTTEMSSTNVLFQVLVEEFKEKVLFWSSRWFHTLGGHSAIAIGVRCVTHSIYDAIVEQHHHTAQHSQCTDPMRVFHWSATQHSAKVNWIVLFTLPTFVSRRQRERWERLTAYTILCVSECVCVDVYLISSIWHFNCSAFKHTCSMVNII